MATDSDATGCPKCGAKIIERAAIEFDTLASTLDPPRYVCVDPGCVFSHGFALELPDLERCYAVPFMPDHRTPRWEEAVQLIPNAPIPHGLPVVSRG